MTTVTLELPEDVFSALRCSPEEFCREMRLAAAIHWYEHGEMSQEKAARIAGLDMGQTTKIDPGTERAETDVHHGAPRITTHDPRTKRFQ